MTDWKPIPMDPALQQLLEIARKRPQMTKAEREAQRRSWVIGEMMLHDDQLTKAQAEAIYDASA